MLGSALAGVVLLVNIQSVAHALREATGSEFGNLAALVTLSVYWIAWSAATIYNLRPEFPRRSARPNYAPAIPLRADWPLLRRLLFVLLFGLPRPRLPDREDVDLGKPGASDRTAFGAEFMGASIGVSTEGWPPGGAPASQIGPLSLLADRLATFTVFYLNTGTLAWRRRGASQVDLVRDSTRGPHESWNPGGRWGWLSAEVYATTTQDQVGPGQIGTFTFSVRVPNGTPPSIYGIDAHLAVALTGERLAPTISCRLVVAG